MLTLPTYAVESAGPDLPPQRYDVVRLSGDEVGPCLHHRSPTIEKIRAGIAPLELGSDGVAEDRFPDFEAARIRVLNPGPERRSKPVGPALDAQLFEKEPPRVEELAVAGLSNLYRCELPCHPGPPTGPPTTP